MISTVLSIIHMLSCLTCPCTHWKRMILPTDPLWSIAWYIKYTYWMFLWMISTALSIINVLSYFTCPYKPWKRMILFVGQLLSIVCYIRLYIVCSCEWSRLSCLDPRLTTVWYVRYLCEWSPKSYQSLVCYPGSHFLIHIENGWSYPLIEFYRPYGILHVFIGCSYEWSHKSCPSLVCYPASRVLIHPADEWSYTMINF